MHPPECVCVTCEDRRHADRRHAAEAVVSDHVGNINRSGVYIGDARFTIGTSGPSTGIVLDTPSPERRIADLEFQLKTFNERLANALESARVRGEALERAEAEVDRLRTIVDEKADLRVGDLVEEVDRLRAELAENSQPQAVWHHWQVIAAMPTVYDGGGKCHESIMRSFHVAEEVRRLLELGTPAQVVLQVMNLLEGRRS